MKRIALTMIVKNEAHIIERCLDSVKDYVDMVFIHDTCSTDGTIKVIKKWQVKNHMPVHVRQVAWYDFAVNRSSVMEDLNRAYPLIDFGFMMDADNVFHSTITPAQFRERLEADLIDVTIHTHGSVHTVPLIYSTKIDARYRGVLHEFMDPTRAKTFGKMDGVWLEQIQDSARNKNPRKYQDDVAVLQKALETETDEGLRRRYTFYLAQSYKDAGDPHSADTFYFYRSRMGGWDQEVFYSHYMIGFLTSCHNKKTDAFLAAYQACPARSESLYQLARMHRERKEYHLAFIYAQQAMQIPMPDRPLFANKAVYEWMALEEYVLACYYTDRMTAAKHFCEELLKRPAPLVDHQRFLSTFEFINKALT